MPWKLSPNPQGVGRPMATHGLCVFCRQRVVRDSFGKLVYHKTAPGTGHRLPVRYHGTGSAVKAIEING